FSSRRRHTRFSRDWIQTCALPIFGWLGYELGAQLERVPLAPRGDLALPDLHVHLVDRLVAHDPVHGRWWAAALGAGADAASASRSEERRVGQEGSGRARA